MLFLWFFHMVALGITGTGNKLAKPAPLLCQHRATLRAILFQALDQPLLNITGLCQRPIQVLLKRLIKTCHRIAPLLITLLNPVQFFLHLPGKPDGEYVGKSRDKNIVHHHPQFGGHQLALPALNILPFQKRGNNCRIGGWSADTINLQTFD